MVAVLGTYCTPQRPSEMREDDAMLRWREPSPTGIVPEPTECVMTYIDPSFVPPEPVDPWRRWTVLVSRAITFLVYLYVVAVEIILGLGFFLLLLGANPSSGFVEWVYRSLDRTMAPFRGIFEPIELGVTSNDVPSILETSVLFAMIVYAIVGMAIHALLSWLNGRLRRIETEEETYRRNQALAQAVVAARQPAPAAQQQPTTPQPPPGQYPPAPPAPPR